MAAVINICESLAVGGKIAMFVVANAWIVESKQDIFITADKAGLLGRFCFDSLARLPKHLGRLASLYLYIQQLFRSQMANVTKNCKAGNNSTRTATPDRAKSVSSNYLSKGSYIHLKGRLNKAERELEELRTPEQLYRVHLLFYYNVGFDQRRYEIDKHYYARSREEALGKAYYEMRITKPDYNLPLTKAGGVELCTLVK